MFLLVVGFIKYSCEWIGLLSDYHNMINYRTHVTIKIGHKMVKEYFDIANIEHYDAILGTPFLRKMGIVLDFRSPGIIQIGNDRIPTGKVSFDELKDTDNNIATKGNII